MTERVATSSLVPLVSGRDLGIRFGATQVLHRADLDLGPGSQVALTGRSGSGKTTLLLLLAGLIKPQEGRVTWPGLDADPTLRRGQIGMVFQAPSLMPELSAVQNVALPLRLRGVDRVRAHRSALQSLDRLGVGGLADAPPNQLSGGQQQRIAIARVMAGGHRLVLADEPTGALDRSHALDAVQVLRDSVAEAGGGLLLATHDLQIADLFDRRTSVLDGTLHHRVTPRTAVR